MIQLPSTRGSLSAQSNNDNDSNDEGDDDKDGRHGFKVTPYPTSLAEWIARPCLRWRSRGGHCGNTKLPWIVQCTRVFN